jgi:hypothetical protein
MRRVLFTVLVLASVNASARAAEIVQVLQLRFASHNSNVVPYNQFNPALGPLNAVTIQTTNGGESSAPFRANNSSSSTVNFNLLFDGSVVTDAGTSPFHTSTPETIGPNSFLDVQGLASFGSAIHVYSGSQVNPFIGTGTNSPGAFDFYTLSADDPAITLRAFGPDRTSTISFAETVTYSYGAPEPASVVMFGIGLSVVAVIAWRGHRSARRPMPPAC